MTKVFIDCCQKTRFSFKLFHKRLGPDRRGKDRMECGCRFRSSVGSSEEDYGTLSDATGNLCIFVVLQRKHVCLFRRLSTECAFAAASCTMSQ